MAKIGTTALYYLLGKLPQVHLSTPKEPYFFEDEYECGPDYYWHKYYAAGWHGQPLVREARAANLFLPYVPQRIQQTVPDARLIVILRDPIDRAFSHWWMHRCYEREMLSFEESLRENHIRIVAGSTIESADAERYLRYFPRSQLCVLMFDEFSQAPLDTTRQLFEFLGIDPTDVKQPPARENVALTNFSRPLYTLSNRLRLQHGSAAKTTGRCANHPVENRTPPNDVR